MTDIQRAMLGDHEVVKRLTEQGVLLPCPCCKGNAVLRFCSGPYYTYNVRVKCESCSQSSLPAIYGNNGTIKFEEANEHGKYEAIQLVIKRWNTRAPLLTPEQIDMLERMEKKCET